MSVKLESKNVSDQRILEPISLSQDAVIANGYEGYSAHIEIAFSLTKADFQILVQPQRKIDFWLLNIFLLTLGWGANILCKYLANIFSENFLNYQPYEIWLLGLGCFCSLVLFFCSKFMQDDQKNLLTEISNHFKNAPKKRVAVKSE